MKHVLALLTVLLFTPLTRLHAAEAPTAKPNIVLIFIDDMGYGDIGPFGSKKNRTPNLDRMAKEGMKLTSFYAAPVCSVSRAQVMTGCYGQRVSLPGVLGPGSAIGINKDEHTVAELLKAQGYATMCIGKWHLGDQPEFFPTRHGFDHYFGLPYSNDMMRKAKDSGKNVVPLVRDEKLIELLTGDDQDRLTERYTDEAVKFIKDEQGTPVFPLRAPHGGPCADPSGREVPRQVEERPLRRLGRGGGLERWPCAGHPARTQARREHARHVQQRQRALARQGQRCRRGGAVARRQGQHLGRRRAGADPRLVARQDRTRQRVRRHCGQH